MEQKLQFEPLKQIIFSNRDSAILLFNYTNSLCIGFLVCKNVDRLSQLVGIAQLYYFF